MPPAQSTDLTVDGGEATAARRSGARRRSPRRGDQTGSKLIAAANKPPPTCSANCALILAWAAAQHPHSERCDDHDQTALPAFGTIALCVVGC